MHPIQGMGVDRRVDHEGISGQNGRRSQGGPGGRICLHHQHQKWSQALHYNGGHDNNVYDDGDEELDSTFDVGPLTGISGHMLSFPLFIPYLDKLIRKPMLPFLALEEFQQKNKQTIFHI